MKKDLGSYRPDSLTSIPEKFMEQIFLNIISEHTKEIQGMTGSVYKRTEVDATHFDFSNFFFNFLFFCPQFHRTFFHPAWEDMACVGKTLSGLPASKSSKSKGQPVASNVVFASVDQYQQVLFDTCINKQDTTNNCLLPIRYRQQDTVFPRGSLACMLFGAIDLCHQKACTITR